MIVVFLNINYIYIYTFLEYNTKFNKYFAGNYQEVFIYEIRYLTAICLLHNL